MTGKTAGHKPRLKEKVLNGLRGPKKSSANGGGTHIKLVLNDPASAGAGATDSTDKE